MFELDRIIGISGVLCAVIAATPAAADDDWRANYTLYGTPGIIDMPTAVAPADGEIATTVAVFGDTQRVTFTFQVLPRVSGSFRYSLIDTYDRSFDLQYQVTDEGQYMPAISVGVRDFIGTGRYSSEYLVATKTLGTNVRVSGGLGWGRLGSLDGFTNPLGIIDERFETRPDDSIDTGGTILSGQFFRGDAALFGGVEWRLNDEWTVLAEYSSDIYERETTLIGFERESPLNFGIKWQPRDAYQLGAYYMYGTDIGFAATILIDPTTPNFPSGLDTSPMPVGVRAEGISAAATWDNPEVETASVDALGSILAADGFRLHGAEVVGNTLRVRYENQRYRAEAQGVGRVSRILTQVAPVNVDTFILEPTRRGITTSSVTIRRSDLEALENEPNAAALSYDRAIFSDAAGPAPAVEWEDPTPAFLWGVAPYLELSLFDGEEPIRGDVGLEATFQYELRPNVILAGAYRYRVAGNRDEVGSISESDLPDVRRTSLRYGAESGSGIENLFMSWYGRPGQNVYSRASVGYFERSFGGVSGELLWKPVDSRLALGAELNYTLLRDYDLGLGFRPACSGTDCNSFVGDDYDVITGHLSAYYDFENGFQGQVDVGRYLAGDWGATFSLDREFDNGWKVGAYFTLTDVPFDDFGEGSFDKGIRIEIPSDWLFGTPTRDTSSTTLSSLERDGGARLRIDGRLYDVVEGGHQGQLEENWGRFWR
ncbi:YjbH domain-containing protein [Octadecabacter sp. CECT 8868]|uniref:YjbH domain-containing protein n=1 Tax=Octadecabacter algicola TaxID=2909342 RepID=UPI001F34DBF7|nr:YjbH domain-containing protein [Octadecabacter algicola]MCF2906223.1 YjbH domain-containing protein [Octadecabacter algicola]